MSPEARRASALVYHQVSRVLRLVLQRALPCVGHAAPP